MIFNVDNFVEDFDKKIDYIWKNKIKDDLEKRRIIYNETTLVASMYHHLRPFIDNFPNLRMFVDSYDPDLKNRRYDLVIFENDNEENWHDQEHFRGCNVS